MGRTHDLVAVAFDGVIDIYKIPVKSALRPTASEGGDDTVKPAPTMPSDVEIFTDVQTKLKDGDVPVSSVSDDPRRPSCSICVRFVCVLNELAGNREPG